MQSIPKYKGFPDTFTSPVAFACKSNPFPLDPENAAFYPLSLYFGCPNGTVASHCVTVTEECYNFCFSSFEGYK